MSTVARLAYTFVPVVVVLVVTSVMATFVMVTRVVITMRAGPRVITGI